MFGSHRWPFGATFGTISPLKIIFNRRQRSERGSLARILFKRQEREVPNKQETGCQRGSNVYRARLCSLTICGEVHRALNAASFLAGREKGGKIGGCCQADRQIGGVLI